MLVINVINDQNVNIYHIVSEVQENKTETVINNREELTVYFMSRAVLLLMSPLLFVSTNISRAAYVVRSVRYNLKHFTNSFFFFFLTSQLACKVGTFLILHIREWRHLVSTQVHRASEWESWHSHTGSLAPEFMGSVTIKWYFTRRRYRHTNLKDDVMKSL